jgi:hypothetical protein
MDESMGTHLVNTSAFLAGSGVIADGTQTVSASTAQACADACDNDNNECIGATFIYTDTLTSGAGNLGGRCLKYLRNPPGGIYDLYVKVLPLDYVSGASKGKAAVASGHYVKWTATTLQHGQPLAMENGLPIPNTLQGCKSACDNMSECWGLYWNGACVLRTGFEAEGHRTFFHAFGNYIE